MAGRKGQKSANATSFGAKDGNPTNRGKPGPGRPTKSFSHFLKNLRNSAAAQEAVKAALSDPESRGFSAALRTVTDYDEEKPAEKKQLSGDVKVSVVFGEE